MKNLLLLTLVTILLYSCGPKITTEQSKKMSLLVENVDSAVYILGEQIDSSEAMRMANHFFKNKQFLEKDMKDTLDYETILLIDKYIKYKKAMGYLQVNYPSFLQEAKVVQQQVKDLNEDIQNRLVDTEQFKKYYDLEYQNYLQLEAAVDRTSSIYVTSSKELGDLTPKIDSIISAYKSRVNE